MPKLTLTSKNVAREERLKRIDAYIGLAFDFLKAQNRPMRATEIAAACGIPSNTSTTVFRNRRFIKTNHNCVWIIGEPLAATKPEPFCGVPKPPTEPPKMTALEAATRQRNSLRQERRELIRQKLIEHARPMTVDELQEQTDIPASHMQVAIDCDMFDRTDRGIWLAGQALPEQSVETCREQARELIVEKGPQKPAVIAAILGCSHELALKAMQHESFMPDLDGYRLASEPVLAAG